MSCDCFCSKNKCKTTIIDSIDDPSTVTLANYDPKVKDYFVIDSFGSTIVRIGSGYNSEMLLENTGYTTYNLGINERIDKDETLIFNTIKINFKGLDFITSIPPVIGNINLQFGIYKLVDKGTLDVGNPDTYDDNSEVITKSDIINFNERTKKGFLDIKLDKNVTIKGNDSENYFLEIVSDIGDNVAHISFQGVSEPHGIRGYRYNSSYTGNLPMPDVLAGADNGGGGATSQASITEIICPYINLYQDYKQLC